MSQYYVKVTRADEKMISKKKLDGDSRRQRRIPLNGGIINTTIKTLLSSTYNLKDIQCLHAVI